MFQYVRKLRIIRSDIAAGRPVSVYIRAAISAQVSPLDGSWPLASDSHVNNAVSVVSEIKVSNLKKRHMYGFCKYCIVPSASTAPQMHISPSPVALPEWTVAR